MWNRNNSDPVHVNDRARVPGVVDTIGIGFETILSRPLLMVPPVFLDLYLWLGVHVTSEPLMVQIGKWLRSREFVGGGAASAVEERGISNIGELAVLWMPTLRMPSFLTTLATDIDYRLEGWRPALSLPWWGIAIAGLILLIVGLVIGSEYLLALAAATAEPGTRRRKPGQHTLRGVVRLAGWYALVAGLGLLITWPILAGYAASALYGGGASFWLVLLLVIPVSWAFVLFFFSVQAMFVDQTGPLPALRSSYRVVRSDSWSSLGLIIAYFLVVVGFPPVWRIFVSEPIGLVVAILGHAFIGTGMIAATMVFYRDRVNRLNIASRI
jgi:hypothetical protein